MSFSSSGDGDEVTIASSGFGGRSNRFLHRKLIYIYTLGVDPVYVPYLCLIYSGGSKLMIF